MRRTIFMALSGCLSVGFAGCGSSNAVWVTCELAKGGKPYTAPDGQGVQVTFFTVEVKDATGNPIASNEPYPAAPSSEGKYEVPGPEGRGVPPGKYRISVVQTPKGTASAPRPKSRKLAPDRDHDFLSGQFGPTNSPIIRTVDQSTHLVLDLDRPTE